MNDTLFLELFGGREKLKLLRQLFEEPGVASSARELAGRAQADPGNTHRWLQKWVTAGLATRDDSTGKYQASADPALRPLVDLFKMDSALASDLRQELGTLDEIEAAAIFGSFARGEERSSSDVDVLVIGRVSELKINALLKPLGRKYGRDFNASVFRRERFDRLSSDADPFVLELLSNPLIPLKGEIHAHGA